MSAAHTGSVSRYYRTENVRQMWRMVTDQTRFHPASGPVERLGADDVERLNTLFSWGGPAYYSAHQIEHTVIFGLSVAGRLVAAAGTHVVSPQHGVAAVGNVFTHVDYRGRGFAKACTSAVVAELLRLGCKDVVLNVRQDNAPAVAAYTALGFRVHCPYIEATARRRSQVEQALSSILPSKSLLRRT